MVFMRKIDQWRGKENSMPGELGYVIVSTLSFLKYRYFKCLSSSSVKTTIFLLVFTYKFHF